MMKELTLYELNRLVRQTLEMTLAEPCWVKAEVSELRVNRHCYLELVQKEKNGGGIVAKARAQVWANRWAMLRPMFEQATGQRLAAGMQVLMQVEVTFHELYGYSLNIIDIDPTYTIGDLARRRQEILRQLEEEGILTMNKELPLPRLLQRIAVISSASAAGYGDFCDQLHGNRAGLAFKTGLFGATMQGSEVERSVVAALDRIAAEQEEWDVVVIIRGGGATSDLQGFDSLLLAEHVAQFPLPIITGIGHERDDTVIDLISHTRVKTPTAAAEFIIHHQEEELAELNGLTAALAQGCMQRMAQAKAQTEWADRQLALYAQARIQSEKRRIELIESQLRSASPDRILRLGFSIARLRGKAVRSASEVQEGDCIETTLASGTIKSTITWIQKN